MRRKLIAGVAAGACLVVLLALLITPKPGPTATPASTSAPGALLGSGVFPATGSPTMYEFSSDT